MRNSILLLLFLLLSPLLIQKFIIVGSVRDTAGRAVGGVRVSVVDENFQPIRTIFVDSGGQFFVRGLSPGRYQFRVETAGTPYQEQDTGWIELQAIRVRPGGTEQFPLDFVLKLRPNKETIKRGGGNVFIQEVPATARAEYQRAVKLFQAQKNDAGLAALNKSIQLFPDYFDALETLGIQFVKNGSFTLALPLLQRAIAINPRAAKSFYSLGVAHLKINQYKEAIESLNKAAEFDITNANTQMMLGISYGYNHQLAEAETAFKRALQLGGEAVAEAHFYLAGVYDKQNRFDVAADELEVYLKQARDIKDRAKVKDMIQKLREKAKGKTIQ